MTKVYRAVVRGQFEGLDADRRARLLQEAAEHDIFRSGFTAEGTFTYDERLVAFNFRYEVRISEGEEGSDPEALAVQRAVDLSEAWLAAAGIGHKHLRAQATDMSAMWRPPPRPGAARPAPPRA